MAGSLGTSGAGDIVAAAEGAVNSIHQQAHQVARDEIQAMKTQVAALGTQLGAVNGSIMGQLGSFMDISAMFDIPIPDVNLNIDFNTLVPAPPDLNELERQIDAVPLPTFTPIPKEAPYQSDLLSATKDRILSDVIGGSTGINPEVENAIWNREFERELQTLRDRLDIVRDAWAESGAPLPDGTMVTLLGAEIDKYNQNRETTSRDIAIKSFEYARDFIKFAIEKAITFEGELMTYNAAKEDRALRSAIEANNFAVTLYKETIGAVVEKIKAYAALFSSEAQIFDAIVRGETSVITAKIQVSDARVRLAAAEGSTLAQMQGNIVQALVGAANIVVDAQAKIAQMSAQLASAAMASVSASASLQAGGHASTNESTSESISESTSVSTVYTHGD